MSKNEMMCADGYGKLHVFRATECCEDEITALKEQIANLEEDVQDAKLDGAVEVNGPSVNSPTSNLKMTGEVTTATNVTGKSLFMHNTKVTAKVVVNVTENVEANDVVVDGAYPGSGSVFSLNNADKVVYKNMKFNATDAYNGVEVGLSSTDFPTEVVFEDCVFTGTLRNNAISVFGMKENGVITLKNCEFESVSNVLRYSNKLNVNGVTINFVNCKIKAWAKEPEYAGLVICQDYTSKTPEETVTNDLFTNDKLTINVENTYYDGDNMTNVVKKHGVQNTVVYVYRDKGNPKAVQYADNAEAYPKVVVK